MNPRHVFAQMLLAAFASVACAQLVTPTPDCAMVSKDASYRTPPLTYPMTSDRYSVQYKLGSGDWTDVKVYISYYGGTNASPFRSSSGYTADTSMSFVSIPAAASTAVALRVTKLFGSAFPAINHVSVRPQAKGIHIDSASGNLVQLSTNTATNFAGDQFLLWWDGDTQQSGSIQGLVFFINPPYARPTGSNVKTIATSADLTGDLSHFDTLDFEGTVAVASTGAKAFLVPPNINNIFLGPSAWLQGKLRFQQSGQGVQRHVYGPGVLDVSRFEYDLRACDDNSGFADQGYHALSYEDPAKKATPDTFLLDGIVIIDHNHAVADSMLNSTVNNVNSIGWNGLNGGFRIDDNTKVSNLFIRAGDDSLMMWGSSITVTNVTVWQTYNGAVVNLGWGNNSTGDSSVIDGLYVVKTDWHSPTNPSWTDTMLDGQNNGIITSLMVPGTTYGSKSPSLYRNIFVEDPPQVLFSLKILFPECADPNGPREGNCANVDLTTPSVLNLNIQNLSTPASVVQNSIGFQMLPSGFSDDGQTFPTGYTLTGSMNIGLTDVKITSPNGAVSALTSANSAVLGNIATNGNNVNIKYTSTCDYVLNLEGQAFTASGGTGTIKITTGAGCPWTVGTLPAGVVLTSAGSGAGNGSVSFQVLPNTGGDVSNSFIIAGQAFTVEQSAASIAGLAAGGSLGQVASEGTWDFNLVAVNLGTSAATARFAFTDNNGNPLALPLTFPQLPPAAGPEIAATLDRTLNQNAQIVIDSTGPDNAATLVGSGQLLSNGGVSGFGIFSNPKVHWNAVVPLETRNASKYFLAFDNTAPLTTGVAVANLTSQGQVVPVIIRDDTGAQIGNPTISLSALGHTSFMLNDPALGFPVTNNKRGTIEFDTPAGGQISVLGLRANGPALTTLPVLANVDSSGGSITHVAYNGGWTSVFYLVNRGNASASFTLSFFDENGVALQAPLLLPQSGTVMTASTLTKTLAAGAMLVVDTQAQDTQPLVIGSAQVATTGNIGGFEIFRWTAFGQEASVPLETRVPTSFILVFDDTNGLTTGVALASTFALPINITATFRDDTGAQIGAPATISLAAHGHTSFLLPDVFPAAAGKRGIVKFVAPQGQGISVIGLRAKSSDGTLTTIPVLTK